VLQWARENGCPWDEKTLTDAAENGHVHVFQWAMDHDCPWDCEEEILKYHPRILKWMKSQFVLSTKIITDDDDDDAGDDDDE
jgi:hypothetical protein